MATLELKKRDGFSLQFVRAILCLSICYLPWTIDGAVDPVIPNEGLSSPSQINAAKNSAVWLHWNYTYISSNFISFNNQEWKVKDMQGISSVIANKTGLSGAVSVSTSLPSHLRGRVTSFANNDTIMISNLQYNDTLLEFLSATSVTVGTSSTQTFMQLKPTVGLSVVGAPEYTSTPANSMEVSEGGELPLALHFNGNPKPTAELQWSHSSAKVAMTVTKEYEFIYKAAYSLKPVTSNYCGRTFNVGVKNSIGKATDVSTTVTVLLNFGNPNLRAGKPNRTCVEVDWVKKESGACSVTYTVNFKTAAGETKLVYIGVNVGKVTKCGIASNVNITNVELKMNSTKRSKTFSTSVSESPLPPPTSAPTTQATTPTTHKSTKSSSNANSSATSTASKATVKTPGPTNKPPTTGANTGAIVGGAIGGVIVLVLILVLILFLIKRGKRDQDKDNDSNEPGLPLADRKENVYATAGNPGEGSVPEPTYAQPEKPKMIYGKLGAGGGRTGPRPPRPPPSEYADVMLDENGYPAVGAVSGDIDDDYNDGYAEGYGNQAAAARPTRPIQGRCPPPLPHTDADQYPLPAATNPPIYAQVDKSRKKK